MSYVWLYPFDVKCSIHLSKTVTVMKPPVIGKSILSAARLAN